MAVILSAPPQPHGSVLSGLCMVLLLRAAHGSPPMAAVSGFKSPAPIFFCSPISDSSHTRLHMPELVSFQLYWAAIMSLGRRGPMSWSQSSLSSHSGAVTQGTRPPSYIWVGKLLPFPWLRADHSYLTYLCNQSKVIDTPKTMPELSCKAVAMLNCSQWPCSICLFPQPTPWAERMETSQNLLDTLSSGPHFKCLFGSPLLAAPCNNTIVVFNKHKNISIEREFYAIKLTCFKYTILWFY
ncbi:hypothetical protein HJG60_008015 [Phyllostomus discolor]|uniref:Uncharacterized protein n=1 Tax=Phyllostomus discolor TaxID=89673 RepID=A0A834EVG2_9CHIR|nr:hypothetical protein HJG60_008015 [Phyllostomus discolor]